MVVKKDFEVRREFEGRGFDVVTGRRVDEVTGEVTELLRTHFLIFEKGKEEPSVFTDFLFDRIGDFSIYGKQFNTKRRYGYIVVRFLNYVFTKIDNIEDLDKDLYSEYINKYSRGELEGERKRFVTKDSVSVDIVNFVLKYFICWLWNKRVKITGRKMFRMKNFKKVDFEPIDVTIDTKFGKKNHKVLPDLVPYETFGLGKQRLKLTNVSWYVIKSLIWISERTDPMLTFPIVLGAFVGLRSGEIAQLTKDRLINFDGSYAQAVIELSTNKMLRSDIKTGHIKGKRYQKVFEGVSHILKEYHEKHMILLSDRGLDNHSDGILFFNKRNDMALTDRSLQRRVEALGKILHRNIYIEVADGRNDLAGELRKLDTVNGVITPHSLRHFYPKLRKEVKEVTNKTQKSIYTLRKEIQNGLGHKSIESQNSYDVATEKEILCCIELIWDNLRDKEGINFLGDRLTEKQLKKIDSLMSENNMNR